MGKFLLICTMGFGLAMGQAYAADKPAGAAPVAPPASGTAVVAPGTAAPATPMEMTMKPGKVAFPVNEFKDKDGVAHFVDPVCGTYGLVTKTSISETYEGKKYFLCSADCQTKFKANPASFTANFVVPARVVSVTGKDVVVTDPVSSQQVNATEKAVHFDHNGRRFYFMSDSTQKMFAADPNKYMMTKGGKGMKGMDKAAKGTEKSDMKAAPAPTEKKASAKKSSKKEKKAEEAAPAPTGAK